MLKSLLKARRYSMDLLIPCKAWVWILFQVPDFLFACFVILLRVLLTHRSAPMNAPVLPGFKASPGARMSNGSCDMLLNWVRRMTQDAEGFVSFAKMSC